MASLLTVEQAVHILRNGIGNDRSMDFSITGSMISWDTSEAAAAELGLHCQYSNPNDYFTFGHSPFSKKPFHRIVR